MPTASIPRELQNLVETELRSGERTVWMEQPLSGRMARSCIPIVIFGIPWTAFALFWTGAAGWGASKVAGGIFSFFPLFGVPFILIGLGMLSSPYWVARRASKSVYVITDKRAIIMAAKLLGGVNVRSFDLAQLKDVERSQNRDGTGDLIFARDSYRDSDGDRRMSKVGFMAISNVKGVEEMIRELTAKSKG